MFESVIAAMLKHKQVVFAAIAVTALAGYIVPASTIQFAQAQVDAGAIVQGALDAVFDGEAEEEEEEVTAEAEEEEATQDIDQAIDQDQESEQVIEQDIDQNEEADIDNELTTGDNTATVTQSNDADQTVASSAEAAAAAEGGNAEDDDHDDDKHKKKHHSSHSDSDSTSADATAIADAVSEATGIQDNDNEANIRQDSRIHDVDLRSTITFGDDTATQVAVPISTQDQTADQRAANIAIEDEIDVYGADVDEDDDDLGISDEVLACLVLPPGQVRECIEGLNGDTE